MRRRAISFIACDRRRPARRAGLAAGRRLHVHRKSPRPGLPGRVRARASPGCCTGASVTPCSRRWSFGARGRARSCAGECASVSRPAAFRSARRTRRTSSSTDLTIDYAAPGRRAVLLAVLRRVLSSPVTIFTEILIDGRTRAGFLALGPRVAERRRARARDRDRHGRRRYLARVDRARARSAAARATLGARRRRGGPRLIGFWPLGDVRRGRSWRCSCVSSIRDGGACAAPPGRERRGPGTRPPAPRGLLRAAARWRRSNGGGAVGPAGAGAARRRSRSRSRASSAIDARARPRRPAGPLVAPRRAGDPGRARTVPSPPSPDVPRRARAWPSALPLVLGRVLDARDEPRSSPPWWSSGSASRRRALAERLPDYPDYAARTYRLRSPCLLIAARPAARAGRRRAPRLGGAWSTRPTSRAISADDGRRHDPARAARRPATGSAGDVCGPCRSPTGSRRACSRSGSGSGSWPT